MRTMWYRSVSLLLGQPWCSLEAKSTQARKATRGESEPLQ